MPNIPRSVEGGEEGIAGSRGQGMASCKQSVGSLAADALSSKRSEEQDCQPTDGRHAGEDAADKPPDKSSPSYCHK